MTFNEHLLNVLTVSFTRLIGQPGYVSGLPLNDCVISIKPFSCIKKLESTSVRIVAR